MATFTAIRCKKQSASSMRGVIDYVKQEKKTRWGNAWLVTGSNCVPQSAFIEMQMTKERFRKTGGTQFYHFVQSLSTEDDITPQEIDAIGLEFAQKQFPDFEVWSPPTLMLAASTCWPAPASAHLKGCTG